MDVCKTLIHLLLLWIFTHYLLFALKRSKFSPKRLPPGPLPLPIVGNLFRLGSKPHKTFTELAKVYGPLFTVELGYVTTVIISSAAMAKEILQKQDVCFSDRNPPCAVSALNHYESSLVMMPPNSKWRNFRKICNSNIFSVSRLDASQGLRRKKMFDPQGICHRNEMDVKKMFRVFDELISERIQSSEANGGVDENGDVLDNLLNICMEDGNEFQLSDIPHLLLDLFIAGTDTTSSTLEWAMAELLRNPKKLKKACGELQKVIGKCNLIEEEDIIRLPYLQAVIKETFRMHPIVPLLPRKAVSTTKLCSFTIPKNTQVFVNIWAVGRDESLWKNANLFEPERFLDSYIDVKGRDFELIPFGAGRRICPGLPLAYRMLPCMLGSLIHLFDWKLEDGITLEKIDMDEKFGLTMVKAKSLYAIPIPV
ncbi:hypothetical protein Ancab_040022 [Ancistrocladus abbreviatus]